MPARTHVGPPVLIQVTKIDLHGREGTPTDAGGVAAAAPTAGIEEELVLVYGETEPLALNLLRNL